MLVRAVQKGPENLEHVATVKLKVLRIRRLYCQFQFRHDFLEENKRAGVLLVLRIS